MGSLFSKPISLKQEKPPNPSEEKAYLITHDDPIMRIEQILMLQKLSVHDKNFEGGDRNARVSKREGRGSVLQLSRSLTRAFLSPLIVAVPYPDNFCRVLRQKLHPGIRSFQQYDARYNAIAIVFFRSRDPSISTFEEIKRIAEQQNHHIKQLSKEVPKT